MAKRIPVKVSVTTRQMTPEEEKRFMIAIDALIGELVEREVDRRIAQRRPKESLASAPDDTPEPRKSS
jgi:hypothetical protein